MAFQSVNDNHTVEKSTASEGICQTRAIKPRSNHLTNLLRERIDRLEKNEKAHTTPQGVLVYDAFPSFPPKKKVDGYP